MSFWDNLKSALGKNAVDSIQQSQGLPRREEVAYKSVPYDGRVLPEAINGHKEPQLNWLDNVSYSDYEDFMSKRGAFDEMMHAWADEDDYQNRVNILDNYNQQYGFSNNVIQRELLNSLRGYEETSRRPENMRKDPGDLPAYSYYDLADYRRGMIDWARENQDYAAWRIGRGGNI